MIKRDIVETTYEYDNEGKLVRKTVTETHETEENTISTTTYPWTYLNGTDVTAQCISTTNSDIPKSIQTLTQLQEMVK